MIVGVGLGAGVVLAVLTFGQPGLLGSRDDERRATALESRPIASDPPSASSTNRTGQEAEIRAAPAPRGDRQAESERQREIVRQVLREELGHVAPEVPREPIAQTSARWKSSRPPPIGDADDDAPALGLMLPERNRARPNRAIEPFAGDPVAAKRAPPPLVQDDAKAIATLVAAGIRCDKDTANARVTRIDGSFRMTDQLMEHVAKLPALGHLKLSFAEVTDIGLAHVTDLGELQELILNQTKITDTGLAHLEKLAKLEKLDLEKTLVSDDGLSRLKMLKQLKHLDIRGSKVTPAAAASLKESLPGAKIRH